MPVVSLIPIGAGIPGRPLGLHGNSGDFTLGSAYNPGEVTGRYQGNGRVQGIWRGNRGRGEAWAVLCAGWRRDVASVGRRGGGPERPSVSVSAWPSPCGHRMDSSDWGRGTEASDPPLLRDPSPAHKVPPLIPLRPRRAAPARRAAVCG